MVSQNEKSVLVELSSQDLVDEFLKFTEQNCPTKTKEKKITVRIIDDEFKLIHKFSEHLKIPMSKLVRDAVFEKMDKMVKVVNNDTEKQFAELLGVTTIKKKVVKTIEKKTPDLENHVEEIVEGIDVSNLDKEDLLSAIQRITLVASIMTSVLRKKILQLDGFQV